VEEWWTYELCYGRRLRQYHKEGGRLASQYVLGQFDEQQPQADEVQVSGAPPTSCYGAPHGTRCSCWWLVAARRTPTAHGKAALA
jgi:hypothetical protein